MHCMSRTCAEKPLSRPCRLDTHSSAVQVEKVHCSCQHTCVTRIAAIKRDMSPTDCLATQPRWLRGAGKEGEGKEEGRGRKGGREMEGGGMEGGRRGGRNGGREAVTEAAHQATRQASLGTALSSSPATGFRDPCPQAPGTRPYVHRQPGTRTSSPGKRLLAG